LIFDREAACNVLQRRAVMLVPAASGGFYPHYFCVMRCSSEPAPPCGVKGLRYVYCNRRLKAVVGNVPKERSMAWTTPTLVEICIGLEINGYLPAEF
jgi:coenzyme PQQ precursor peptide PqqA